MGANSNRSESINNISVSTEQLNESVCRIKNLYNTILQHIDNVEKCVSDSPCYWSTEGSELLIRLFADDTAESKRITAKIKRQIMSIDDIMALYDKTEREAVDTAQTLPSSIIDW